MHLWVRTMDDLISREVAAKILRARAEMATGTPKEVFFAAADMLEKLPAVDAVEVVRCRDCTWWSVTQDSLQGKCLLNGDYPAGGWYCANGCAKAEDAINAFGGEFVDGHN